MAVRKQLWHPDEVRQKIQASQLINRLTNNALSEQEIMTAGQVRSAEVLLKKAIPDLAAVQHTGANGGPIQHEEVGAARDALLGRIGLVSARVGTNSSSPKPH